MRFGSLLMPSHPPEVTVREGQRRDLKEIQLLDRLGFDEVWIGEHFTAKWEPCPSPDLLIAQALQLTERIRLGSLGHLLPYHNPIELAHRVAYLDHMAEGRYQLGVGVSALPSDHEIFGIDISGGKHRRMTYESIRIMTELWTKGSSDIAGEFWSMGEVRNNLPSLGYHLTPFQTPYPPIAIAGLTPRSSNHKLAGEKGFIPVSLSVSPDASLTAMHWEAVEEGASLSGRKADRNEWRIIRDVYVAPTDAEARDQALNGIMGRCWKEFLLPIYLGLGLGEFLKTSPSMSDEAVTIEYLAENLWLVGSPETVALRIAELHAKVGGFGVLLNVSYDSADESMAWQRSLSLLLDEVRPRCEKLIAKRMVNTEVTA